MTDIKIHSFSGMNNIDDTGGFYVKEGIVQPQVITNADVTQSGTVVKRPGKTLFISLPGAHSLSPSHVTLCMCVAAKGILYMIINREAVPVGTIDGFDSPLSYEQVDDKIYISNMYWRGILTPSTRTVSNWGVPLPPGPMMLVGSGNLPAGIYKVCMTNVVGGELSGNGAISTIELESEGGIVISNRPDDAVVWCTDSNEPIFYKVGEVDTIINVPTIEPLPSFLCAGPPLMSVICYAFGLMWGAVGKNLYYSEPNKLSWFKLAGNQFSFDSDINTIARVPTGLFIGMESQTRFLHGTEPEKMVETHAGPGTVKGTLVYCNNVPYLADTLGTSEKVFVDVPVWRTTDSIVAGNTSGRLFNLTQDKLNMGTAKEGASLHQSRNGIFRFLTSSLAASIGVDAETLAAFQSGQLPVNNITNKNSSSMMGFSENVSCEVWRDGVLITE